MVSSRLLRGFQGMINAKHILYLNAWLQVLDYLTTKIGLMLSLPEMNPLMVWLQQFPVTYTVVKLGFALILVLIARVVRHKDGLIVNLTLNIGLLPTTIMMTKTVILNCVYIVKVIA